MNRNYCFTLNNWTQKEYDDLLTWDCKYMVIGQEIGKNGTPHLQGYIEFEKPKRLSTIKKENERIHWETRKGNAKQASEYCKKEGKWVEKGKMSEQGKRNDLIEACDDIKNGISLKEIALKNSTTYVKYYKGLEKLKNFMIEPRTEPPYIEWRWGEFGTGKSRYVWDSYDIDDIYNKDNTKWWDGYSGQKVILIDDFDAKEWNYRDLLRLLDRYPYQGQTKGGYVNINSPYIYITCEFSPDQIWTHQSEKGQILRRVTHVTEVGGNTSPPLPKTFPRPDNIDVKNDT